MADKMQRSDGHREGDWRGFTLPWLIIGGAFVALVAAACWINFTDPRAIDFLSFWAAGRMALEGAGALAYDVEAHRAVEAAAAPIGGILPFPYPPPFLLIVAPFALSSFSSAFAAWVFATGAIYLLAARPLARPAVAAAHPCVVANGFVGQNGFLTAAIFIAGTSQLKARPWLGGAILGLLIVKPQLALMLPIALIAGREWRAIGGGVLSSAALAVCALLAFGPEAYAGFLAMLPSYAAFMGSSRWPWEELASLFAFARYFGAPAAAAFAIHGVVALIAAALVWRAWRRHRPERVAILAAATVLAPPYLFSYDALLLVVPLAWLARSGPPWLVALVWLLSLLPVAGFFGLYEGPNTLPVAALLSLGAIYFATTAKPAAQPIA